MSARTCLIAFLKSAQADAICVFENAITKTFFKTPYVFFGSPGPKTPPVFYAPRAPKTHAAFSKTSILERFSKTRAVFSVSPHRKTSNLGVFGTAAVKNAHPVF